MRKFFIGATLLAAAGAGAFWLGQQMPDEVVMSLAGIMCGIVASIPVSVGLLVLLTRDTNAPRLSPEIHEDAPQVVETYAEQWTVSIPPPAQLNAPTRQIDA